MYGRQQFNPFKGKKKREHLPPTPEFELHCQLAEILKRWCRPEWRYTHIPLGEERSWAAAARLRRMGVVAGWPDFIFVGPGKVFFLELKAARGGLSVEQAAISEHLLRSGCGYLCTDDFVDAVMTLKEVGILFDKVSVT